MSLQTLHRHLSPGELAVLRSLAFRRGTVIEHDGLSVLSFGRAAELELDNGLTDPVALAEISRTLQSLGPGATALGAFCFRPDAAARLVVPQVCIRSVPGETPVAVIVARQPGGALLEALLEEAASLDRLPAPAAEAPPIDDFPPDSFVLRSVRPHEDFLARLAAALDEVRSGRLEKVVMAREVLIEANRPLRQGDLLERLRSLHPSCTTFAVEGFLGATPELLIRRCGLDFESRPLAGTAARSGDPAADRRAEAALLGSAKERAEHRAVVDAITAGLRPALVELHVPEAPSIVELRNVSHLGTHITGRLADRAAVPTGRPVGGRPVGGRPEHRRDAGGPANALELLALIHPTPAVSGSPVDLALDYLAKAEELDRDRYGGAVGWIDGRGDGEWFLGIRCAVVKDRTARLFAGVGIVEDSDPVSELAETQLKLQAFLAAAVRP